MNRSAKQLSAAFPWMKRILYRQRFLHEVTEQLQHIQEELVTVGSITALSQQLINTETGAIAHINPPQVSKIWLSQAQPTEAALEMIELALGIAHDYLVQMRTQSMVSGNDIGSGEIYRTIEQTLAALEQLHPHIAQPKTIYDCQRKLMDCRYQIDLSCKRLALCLYAEVRRLAILGAFPFMSLIYNIFDDRF